MAKRDESKTGTVFLVGAGPGDPGMLTLRAAECLRRGDVILYDYLVNPRILRHAHSNAEMVCLGRHGHGRIWSQEEINDKLVELAAAGKNVVRLKGGDPAVFARGAQEAEHLSKHQTPFEIVPGITVALAAGSCAGIPITHYDFASAVALITGQERPGKEVSSLDFEALAKFPGTLVFYMGVTTAEQWTSQLIAAGKSAETPTAIVRRCSLPDQQAIRCTLGKAAELFTGPEKVRPPAIVIVGEVTTLAETLSWFEHRPLFGQRVLVTRPVNQAAQLTDRLLELGADVLEQPAIEISDPPDWQAVDEVIQRLADFDWLVFSSANGVRYFFDRLLMMYDIRVVGHLKFAAIGPGTASALAQYHLQVDVQPPEFRAESLVETLAEHSSGRRFLYPRASRGRDVLPGGLIDAGASVEQVVVYTHASVTPVDESIRKQMANGEIHWTTVTSSEIGRSLVDMFGEGLKESQIATISPVTSEAMRELGMEPTTEATEYTMQGVVDAILNALT